MTTVAGVDPDDGDALTYAITGGSGSNLKADEDTGAISVNGLSTMRTMSAAVNVRVTDSGGLMDTATITIAVTDVNEAPSNDSQANVQENACGTVVTTVTGSDPDDGDTLSYAIIGGNNAGHFAVNQQTGVVTVAGPIDHETDDTYTPGFGYPTDSCCYRKSSIAVTDVNEAPSLNNTQVNVPENALDGTLVTTITGTDPDGGDTLSYAMTGGNDAGHFTSTNRAVPSPSPVPSTPSPMTPIPSRSRIDGELTDTATITITVNDINEAPAIADAQATVAENSANGTLVANMVGTDPDDGDTLGYAIIGGNAAGHFAINANTGAVTVAGPIDHETNDTYTCDSGVRRTTHSCIKLTITVTDVNEGPSP